MRLRYQRMPAMLMGLPETPCGTMRGQEMDILQQTKHSTHTQQSSSSSSSLIHKWALYSRLIGQLTKCLTSSSALLDCRCCKTGPGTDHDTLVSVVDPDRTAPKWLPNIAVRRSGDGTAVICALLASFSLTRPGRTWHRLDSRGGCNTAVLHGSDP